MKTNIILILLFFVGNSCFAQKNTAITIEEVWTPLKTYVHDEVVKNNESEKKFSYTYIISQKKDSILYFDNTESINNKKPTVTYILKKNKQALLIKDHNTTDSITINFSDQENSININTQDTYFLNSKYYEYLKNSVHVNKNIVDLIDLLDDALGDYPYQLEFLKRISSNKKYKDRDFKIIKAKISTKRTQSDIQDIWHVNYAYNNDHILESVVKKSTENDLAFEKKLISKKGTEYRYKIFNNVEGRFEDDDEITFDTEKNSYNALQSHFQFGLVKEQTSQLKRILYKKH